MYFFCAKVHLIIRFGVQFTYRSILMLGDIPRSFNLAVGSQTKGCELPFIQRLVLVSRSLYHCIRKAPAGFYCFPDCGKRPVRDEERWKGKPMWAKKYQNQPGCPLMLRRTLLLVSDFCQSFAAMETATFGLWTQTSQSKAAAWVWANYDHLNCLPSSRYLPQL